jgi:DNA-binding NtrC family response regulator
VRAREPPAFTPDALRFLVRYPWPGNIRELKNAIERAVLLCPGHTITRDLLPTEKMAGIPRGIDDTGDPTRPPATSPSGSATRIAAGAGDREAIIAALARCAGNQSLASRALGISRKTLIRRMIAFGLPRPRKGTPEV